MDLNDLLWGWGIIILLAMGGVVGYFVGVSDTNNFWLSQGDYSCQLIRK